MWNDPAHDALVAAVVVGLVTCGLIPQRAARTYDSLLARLAATLRDVGLFPDSDLRGELQRLDLLRIVLGLTIFGRFWPLLIDNVRTGNASGAQWTGLGLLLTVGIGAGVATPLAALLMAWLLNTSIDRYTAHPSLGSMVVANCLIPLVVAPAGHTLSVDSLVMRRCGPAGEALRAFYALWGSPTVDRVQVGRFLGLVAFAAINAYSAIAHLQSPTWTSGAATAVVLLSPTASRSWSTLSLWIYENATWTFLSFSLISTYGMLLWQLLMLPLALLSRWLRWLVIVWGVMFFAFATYVMFLKRLGVYEVVLWALVFWNGRMFPDRWRRIIPGWSIPRELPPPERSGHFASALSLAFAVSLVLFGWASLRQDATSKGFNGAPLMFGMGEVDVFNELDLRMYRNRSSVVRIEADGTQRDLSFVPGEARAEAMTRRSRYNATWWLYCDEDFARIWFGGFAQSLPPSHPDRSADVEMAFASWTRPTNEELTRLKYVPMTWETFCTIRANLQQPSRVSIRYSPAAAVRAAAFGIDFALTDRRLALALRFPCHLEIAAAARWYDRPTRGDRSKADLDALRELFNAEQVDEIRCFLAHNKLVSRLAQADQRSWDLRTAESCESESQLVEVYYRDVFDDALRKETAAKLEVARAAQKRGDVVACRQSAAAIRRAYVEAIYRSD